MINYFEDYLEQTLLEKYKSWSKHALLFKREDLSYITQTALIHPQVLLWNHRAFNNVYAIVPVLGGRTRLMEFDIDGHGTTPDSLTREAANKIEAYLTKMGLHPELVISSTPSNYRVSCWSAIPQSCEYVNTVQKEILKEVGLADAKFIQCLPGNGVPIRPWWWGNELKQAGFLIKSGQQDKDFSALKNLFYRTKTQQSKKPRRIKQQNFNVDDFIPQDFGTRNQCLMGLVQACKQSGLDLKTTLAHSTYIHQKGKVKDTLPNHLKQTEAAYKGFGTKSAPSLKSVLSNLSADISDTDLFLHLSNVYKSCKGFSLTCEAYGEFRQITPKAAWKRLRKYVRNEILEIVRLGQGSKHREGRIATLYKLGSRFPVAEPIPCPAGK